MKAFKLLALTSCVLLAAGNGVAQQNYSKSEGLLQYVDPYIGSGYHGHVFVGTSVPYGMVQLGPTNIHKGWDWCSGYHYSDSILIGFSHTHLSGTGCTDLCDILIMPLNEIRTPRGNQDDIRDGYASRYSHANEIARPEYYSLLLDRYNIKAELTATDRVGFHRYTYPEGKPASILIDLREGNGSNAYDSYIRKVDDYTVEGYRYVRGWSPSRKVYFVLKSDKKIEQFTAYDDNNPQPWDQLKVASVKSVLTFGNVKEVKIKVALSSVSCDNAAMNLQSELTHWDFDKVVDMSAYNKHKDSNCSVSHRTDLPRSTSPAQDHTVWHHSHTNSVRPLSPALSRYTYTAGHYAGNLQTLIHPKGNNRSLPPHCHAHPQRHEYCPDDP